MPSISSSLPSPSSSPSPPKSSSSSSSTPTMTPSPLPLPLPHPAQPQSQPQVQVQVQTRPRGHSTSNTFTTITPTPLSRVISAPSAPQHPTEDANEDGAPRSSLRARVVRSFLGVPGSEGAELSLSLSGPAAGAGAGAGAGGGGQIVTPPNGAPSSWWGRSASKGKLLDGASPRPWSDPPKKKKTVPEEQTERWVQTRERVARAAKSVLGTAGDVAHEALFMSVDALEFVPVAGLAPAARTLLAVWDALQLVDMNRLACLRLTERCADILLAVRQEVKDAGDLVGEELAVPLETLDQSFASVHNLMLKQAHRPFIKRYLKRDEIRGHIAACDAGLGEALGMFGLSIQIRILKQVREGERRREREVKEFLEKVGGLEGGKAGGGGGGSGGSGAEVAVSAPKPTPVPTPVSVPVPMSPPTVVIPEVKPTPVTRTTPPTTTTTKTPTQKAEVLPALRTLQGTQNALDASRDAADLRGLMKAVLSAGSDVEMVRVLQIGREEMPEAIKTLQRALERVVEEGREDGVGAGVGVEAGGAGAGAGVEDKGKGKGVVGKKASVGSAGSSGKGSGTTGGEEEEGGWGRARRDTLDREFIESGIDALRRMSRGAEMNLPSWTITRYEVDRDEKIGIGFFSDVYKGTWRGRTVAIKVLAESTPRELFRREVAIWKRLRHENVLELYGASSASGDPPWFFVSPYERNGSLVEFLRRVESGAGGVGTKGGVVGLGLSGMGVPARGRMGTFPVWGGVGLDGNRNGGEGRSGSRGSRVSPGRGGSGQPMTREGDLFRFMLEIAQGMEYLHKNGVLHGDLKAANVLVNDQIQCVISDFGQSEMKSEVYRISGTPPPHGTLRWQAPELISGLSQLSLTPEMDVYAYAISCVEILTMGRMPWALMDDDAVRHFVLRDNIRPTIPITRFNTPLLQELLRVCWHRDPAVRPSFEKIVKDVKVMRKAFLDSGGANGGGEGLCSEESSTSLSPLSPAGMAMERHRDLEWDWEGRGPSRPSPDMRPAPLPSMPIVETPRSTIFGTSPSSAITDGTFETAQEYPSSSPIAESFAPVPHLEETVTTSCVQMPEPVFFTPSAPSSRASSLFTHTPSTGSREALELDDLGLSIVGMGGGIGGGGDAAYEGYDSPPPMDERIAMMRDERRYRLLLSHQFHPSLTLPLWDPVPVGLGAVGYLLKPKGTFVTLFDAFHPERSSDSMTRGLPSVYGYGRVTNGSQRQDKRSLAQRGLDAFVGLLTFKGRGDGTISQRVSRRYSFPLRSGHKTAQLCTESTIYGYVENLDAPKKWFKANVDTILQIYGPTHHIQKEDLFLVIGKLDAQDYALFVSHSHPDGQAHFNVFSAPKNGKPWGTFTTDTEVPPELGGPSYHEPAGTSLSACKISTTTNGSPWDTVLLARLRFKPDVLEPTSL